LLYVLLGIPVVFVTWALVHEPDPYSDAKFMARESISTCWDEQTRKSHAAGEARFIAGVCEKMERDFTAKYGHNP
jgi:hypothetical protein